MAYPSVASASLPVVDARDFGVKGDGNTDNGSAINSALAQAATAGLPLSFPSGLFMTASTLKISTNATRVIGAHGVRNSENGTEISFSGAGACWQLGSDDGNPWDANEYNGVQDFQMENVWTSHAAPDTALALGGQFGSYKAGAYGLQDWRGGSIVLANCGFEKFDYNFFGVQSDINSFFNIVSLYSHHGIYAGPRSDQFSIQNLYSFFCDQTLIVDRAAELRLIDAQIVGCGTQTLCPIDIYKGTAGTRIVRPWLEHGQGYTGTDQIGFIACGVTNGYSSTTTSAQRIIVDAPHIITVGSGLANHTKTLVVLGAAYDVRVDNPSTDVGLSDDCNLDAFITAPAGTSYDATQSFAQLTGVDNGFSLSQLFFNSGSGTPGFVYISDVGTSGYQIYNSYNFEVKGCGLTVDGDIANGGAFSTGGGSLAYSGALAIKGAISPSNTAVKWLAGSGTPEGAVTAPVGSLYTRTDGGSDTTLYVKETGTGNTGWTAK